MSCLMITFWKKRVKTREYAARTMMGKAMRTNNLGCNPLGLRETEESSGPDDENRYHQEEGEGQSPGGIQEECDVLLHYRYDVRCYYRPLDAADSPEDDDDEGYGEGSPTYRRGQEDYIGQ